MDYVITCFLIYSYRMFCKHTCVLRRWMDKAKLEKMEMEKKMIQGASLVAQWLRICLPMQGTQVQALVQEDPTCLGATKPVRHNY